jgi:hypothetical protein
MAGNATLNPNCLIDNLTPMIDQIRSSLYPAFGIDSFRVFTVLRTWAGQMVGEGDYTDVVNELSPPPRIEQWNGYKWVLLAAGAHEDGEIRLSEVSLTYTYKDLVGDLDPAQRNQQFFYRFTDAHGQGQEDRLLRQNRPPQVVRDSKRLIPGWCMWLMDMNIPDGTTPEVPGGL